MPVVLTTEAESTVDDRARRTGFEAIEATSDGTLKIVAGGEKEDPPQETMALHEARCLCSTTAVAEPVASSAIQLIDATQLPPEVRRFVLLAFDTPSLRT